MTRGRFIVFEGIEGSGKTTQVEGLAARLIGSGRRCIATKEPGGTRLGERIRELLLTSEGIIISPRAELLLFAASRAQIVDELIGPQLDAGVDVVVDRYVYSTLAYQGFGRSLDRSLIEQINAIATGGLLPDLVVLLDLPPAAGIGRKSLEERNRFEDESLEFHERVRTGYLELARCDPGRWLIVDARLPQNVIAGLVWNRVASLASPADRQGTEAPPNAGLNAEVTGS